MNRQEIRYLKVGDPDTYIDKEDEGWYILDFDEDLPEGANCYDSSGPYDDKATAIELAPQAKVIERGE